MSAFFGRFHGDTKPEPGEPKSVRDAYDAQWDQQKRLPVVAPKGEKGGKK